ncbi:hypothetical protein [Duncaniella muris]|uniref:hypothetical protein n=1 Tax=Duncaniella muris TaxID=2094150 RepID=UPI003F66F033
MKTPIRLNEKPYTPIVPQNNTLAYELRRTPHNEGKRFMHRHRPDTSSEAPSPTMPPELRHLNRDDFIKYPMC